jgi:hypothetical protein
MHTATKPFAVKFEQALEVQHDNVKPQAGARAPEEKNIRAGWQNYLSCNRAVRRSCSRCITKLSPNLCIAATLREFRQASA